MAKLILDIYHGERGIDLAEWKRRHGLWGVIVKCGGSDDGYWNRYEETTWVEQVTQAHALGLHVGGFYYSDALNAEDALADAKHCVHECMRGMSIDMPLYIDIEERSQLNLPKARLTEIVKTWCDYVSAAGYQAGIYSGYEGFGKIDPSAIAGYSRWLACWQDSWPTWASDYDLWQEGSMSLDGQRYHRNEDVNRPGRVDLDWASDAFVATIENGGGNVGKLSYALAAAEVMDHFVDHDAHGYSQIHRDGTAEVETITLSDGTEVSFQSGDRDCSRLVQTCYVVVGALPKGLHVWTGNECATLLANGFIEVPLDNLARGDVLWRSGHTELYMGDNIEAGARRSETGGIDGRTGDQDGGEIDRSTFVRSHWTSAYRCAKRRPGEGGASHAPADLDTIIGGGDMVGLIHQADSAGATHVYYWDGVGAPQHISPAQLAGIARFYRLTHGGAAIPACKDMPADEFEALCKL